MRCNKRGSRGSEELNLWREAISNHQQTGGGGELPLADNHKYYTTDRLEFGEMFMLILFAGA